MCKPPPGAFTPRMPAGGSFPSPCIRNASSTASMHSGKVSSCSTSLRRSRKVPSVLIRRADQARDLVAGYCFDRAFSAAKNSGAVGTAESYLAVLGPHPCALAHSEHGRFIFLEKLEDAFFLRFAHVLRSRIGILKVRADLERHQAERIEGARLDDR